MLNNKKIIVVLPAYNAAGTLRKTYNEIPFDIVDEVVIVDDASPDNTVEEARAIGIKHIIQHDHNKGYGGNQKSCYNYALQLGGDIVIMLHPDYQYTPRLITAMASIISNDLYPVVIASRILGKGALRGGMPFYKYVFNRMLTLFQNVMMNQKLSEYHTGYRAFRRDVLETIPFNNNSDDFVFDNEFLAQVFYFNFDVGEVTCPTLYEEASSSINFSRSVTYGLGVLRTSLTYFFARMGLYKSPLFKKK